MLTEYVTLLGKIHEVFIYLILYGNWNCERMEWPTGMYDRPFESWRRSDVPKNKNVVDRLTEAANLRHFGYTLLVLGNTVKNVFTDMDIIIYWELNSSINAIQYVIRIVNYRKSVSRRFCNY